ncbi:MAG TPA: SPOR domain-containing protein [Steroidobacteraceae bacterium]|jgi:DedD protein|nr:SPOR domain-containing protein [Steroidobacteraceae bacterium]
MERRVKERLIGASILVALIVLVVPELLSGPRSSAPAQAMLPAAASEPVRNVTVDLNTSKPPPKSEVEALDAEPEPAASSPAVPGTVTTTSPATPRAPPATPRAPPATVPVSPATSPVPAAKPPAAKAMPAKPVQAKPARLESAPISPTSTAHAWSVQLGSFAKRANADNLSRQLKGQGYSVYVLPGGSGSSTRYRVRVGPLADRESAERTASRLKSQGHVSSLVAPAA